MTPYDPPKTSSRIELDLSRNEGSSWFLDSVGPIENLVGLANRYPRTSRLRSAIAERHHIEEGQVLVTAGGDDALSRCFLAMAGGTFIATTPTFEMVRRYGEQSRSTRIDISWWDGPFPLNEFAAAATESSFSIVVSPNNPTGQAITPSDLRQLAGCSPLVVLDSAYAEFGDVDLTTLALELENVVVIRTLSKAFGLAGLRVGYLIGPTKLIEKISAFGSPYPVSGISAYIAELALKSEPAPRKRFIDEVGVERKQLQDLVESFGLKALSSQGNFLLVSTSNADWLTRAMGSLGIALRTFPGQEELADSVRISLPGRRSEFKRLVESLTTVLVPECLLFDLDGVIVDVSQSYHESIIATAASFGVEVTPADISALKTAGNANDDWDITMRLCGASGVRVDSDEVIRRFETNYQGSTGRPGLKVREQPLVDAETLARWKTKLPLGIVTGRPRRDAEEVLERFGFTEFFDIVVTRDDAPMKPDPAPVRLALEKLGANHGWLLGDTRDDIAAARLAGVLPIAVSASGPGATDAMRALADAAAVLNSTAQLQEILDDTHF